MKKTYDNLTWNVYRYDFNKNEIILFNVFNHYNFYKYTNERLNKIKDKDEFSKELNKDAMYCFWSKYEYELLIGELSSREDAYCEKIDIYNQLRMNWDNFIDYIWSHK